MTSAHAIEDGSLDGVEYAIYDLTLWPHSGVASGYYYTAGSFEGEAPTEENTTEVVLEGPFPTPAAAREAAHKFILDALFESASDEEPLEQENN